MATPPAKGSRPGATGLRGGPIGDNGAIHNRRGWKSSAETETDARSVVQLDGRREEERERPGRHHAAHAGQIRTGDDETAPLSKLLEATFPTSEAVNDKGRLQVSLSSDTLAANHRRKVVHLHRGSLVDGITNDFRWVSNPSQWSDVSEVIADLANDLVRREDWDETEWQAPQQGLLSSGKAIDNDRGFIGPEDEFEQAFEMSIDTSLRDDSPTFDCYLDDLFGIGLERDQARLEAAVPLALHLVGRPDVDNESFPRDNLLSSSKFLAEAKASERKIILGWVINTRAFAVSLPVDKHRAWTNDLRRIRNQPGRRASSKELEAMIGRLNHAAFVVPNSRPFLGRLYRASERAQTYGSVKLSQTQLDDLALVVRVDACPQGLGGYGLQSGVAWRIQLDPDLIGRGTLNALEFLAALIGVWVEHQLGPEIAANDVLLSQGDSTSATGWMAKSSFGDECPIQLALARELASYLTHHGLAHYSQWFPGKENSVADALSRDFKLNDADLVSLVLDNFAEQVPEAFRIVPLPEAIITNVGRLLRLQPKTQQLPTSPVPSAAAAGRGMRASSQSSVMSGTTLSSGSWDPKTASTSSPASQQRSARGGTEVPDSLLGVALDGRRAQFVPPSTTWQSLGRSSGRWEFCGRAVGSVPLAGAFLAFKHFNDRNPAVLPHLPHLLEGCDIQLTTEIYDSHGSPIEAAKLLSGSFWRNHSIAKLDPMAIIGCSCREDKAVAVMTGVYGVPHISPFSGSTELDNGATFPTFARIIPNDQADARSWCST
ncbi:hypothetical protein MHU86_4634 [Fragilaria crotonensis]|nr:hypothetical protein MHU86_4634 [Fragilaria crotonensis]